MANLIGDDFKLYNDTTNAANWTPTVWVLQTDISDLAFDRGVVDVQIDDRTGFVKHATGRQNQRLTFTVNYDEADAFVVALEGAVAAGTSLHVAIADGLIAVGGTNYWHGDWVIVGNPLSANLDEGATLEIELGLASSSANTPAKVSV